MANSKGRDGRVANVHEPMLEMFIFETNQLLEQLEQLTIQSEKNGAFSSDEVNEVFRIMHTIKGSSSMMLVNEVAALAHSIEDIFFYMRERHPETIDCSSLTDLILSAADFIKGEVGKIEEGKEADGAATDQIEATKFFLVELKRANGDAVEEAAQKKPPAKKPQKYYIGADKAAAQEELNVFAAVVFYEAGCEMENIRAYTVLNLLQEHVAEAHYLPENILEDDDTVQMIRESGFKIWFTTSKSYDEIETLLKNQVIFLDKLELRQLKGIGECEYWPGQEKLVKEIVMEDPPIKPILSPAKASQPQAHESVSQAMISVNVHKLDRLMDLVGELVIAEAMVTQNPELKDLELNSFHKAARQLRKISGELQDSVMAIRMVPLSATFHKMNRIVRDMSKKLGKKVELVLIGEDTEVDKNVIEHISDPLMHLIRNSIDHGIELPEERTAAGKSVVGRVTLEAQNAGNEVVISIKDDGKGLDRERILQRARDNALFTKPEAELTDKEIYAFIFSPGFSTKEKVTEYSGRGVGMDVVMQNITAVGGTILIDSNQGKGSVIRLKIPLTLAIIDAMSVEVGTASYTIPIMAIRESFRPSPRNLLVDPDGNEMIMVRGQCYPVVRLHKIYGIDTKITDVSEGIMIMVESEKQVMGIFADRLVGVQQIVVKPVPNYIKKRTEMVGITGCTLLGDGSISLILDATKIAGTL